jgi:hypothetical protein
VEGVGSVAAASSSPWDLEDDPLRCCVSKVSLSVSATTSPRRVHSSLPYGRKQGHDINAVTRCRREVCIETTQVSSELT